jgi:hypothetical protein
MAGGGDEPGTEPLNVIHRREGLPDLYLTAVARPSVHVTHLQRTTKTGHRRVLLGSRRHRLSRPARSQDPADQAHVATALDPDRPALR